eukprot:4243219-Alexandrium_andersonii.AAC.1
MTASASAASTGRSWPGCGASATSTDSISGAEGTDCELTGALDPPRAGAPKQEPGGPHGAGEATDWSP